MFISVSEALISGSSEALEATLARMLLHPAFGVWFLSGSSQGVPGDGRGDGVDTTVLLGRRKLDATSVRLTYHAHSRYPGSIEFHAVLLGQPVEQADTSSPS